MKPINNIQETIKKYRLLERHDIILVGLSGGPDSVALLCLLNSLKKQLNIQIVCAHLNHMLRGKDSEKDLLFAHKLCTKLKIPLFCESIDIRKKHNSASLEETARKLRQDFLFRVADKTNVSKIALGHTKDDQAETVLMRILRGSGLYGLSAILPKRKISSHILIRPLIELTKKEILAYLKKKKQSYRIDQTNKEDIYFRNRIRKTLIPQLKKYNKNIVEVLSNTAQSVSLDYEYIKNQAGQYLTGLNNSRSESRVIIERQKLSRLHPAIRRMVLRLAIEKISGNLRRLTFKHIEELEDLLDSRKNGSIVDLPHNISSLLTVKSVKFYRRKKTLKS